MKELDWDALLRSTATETLENDEFNNILMGDLAQGLARTSSLDLLPSGIIEGDVLAPDIKDVSLGHVLGSIVKTSPVKEGPQPVPQSTLNVAQCIDFWAREYQQGAHPMAQMQPVFATGTAPVPIHVSAQALAPAVVVPGAVLPFLATNTNPPDVQKKRKDGSGSDSGVRRKISAQIGSDGSAEKVDVSGRGKKKGRGKKTGKVDERVLRNRESAARSRAKRLEYTNELEQKVKTLKDTNKELRKKVIKAAKAPPDPYAGTLNGKQLRRTRTMPL